MMTGKGKTAILSILCSVAFALGSFAFIGGVRGAAEEGGTVQTGVVSTKPLYLTEGSEETVTNGTFDVQDFADSACGWKDQGWGGFDNNRGKITYAWLRDMVQDLPIGLYQDVAVEKNTDYYLVFNASQTLIGAGRALTVGFSDPAATTESGDPDWTAYLDGQKCDITGIGEAKNYYVAFNSGEYETVRLRFETQYMCPEADNTFGGFFLDDVSLKKITGEAEVTLDVAAGVAEGQNNYVYVGESGNTTQLAAEITNLEELGLSAEDVTIVYSSTSNPDIATVSENGLITAGTEAGPVAVTVTATADLNGKEIAGTASLRIRCIYPTDEGVYLDPTQEQLPLVTTGENLLKNGDFESEPMDTSTTDHTQRADNWRSVIGTWMNTEAGAGIEDSTGAKITWRWENGLTEDDTPGFYQDVTVKANTVYQLSFVVFNWAGVANGQNDLYVGYRNPKGSDIWSPVQEYKIATPDIRICAAGDWAEGTYTNVTVYLYTGELTDIRVFAYTYAQSGHDGGAGWWFDNWSLLEVADTKPGAQMQDVDANIPQSMRTGGEIQLKTFAVYIHDFRKDISDEFTPAFVSSAPDVVAVENGKLVAKKEGTATITASGTYEGFDLEKEYTVTVKPIPKSLTVKVGTDNTIAAGRDQKIAVTLVYSDGTTETVSSNITYTVSDSTIIAQKGSTNYLSGKAAGKATLTARLEIDGYTVEGSVEVTVLGDVTDEPTGGAPVGLIVGICVAAVVVIGGAVAGIVIWRRKRSGK